MGDRKNKTVGVWFRKGLRLQDNEALIAATAEAQHVVLFFVLDPWFDAEKVGTNRWRFLLECLQDLDAQLRANYKQRLVLVKAKPERFFEQAFAGRAAGFPKLDAVFYEYDSEPYSRSRDAAVQKIAQKAGAECRGFQGHTLLDIEAVVATKGYKNPTQMSMVEKLLAQHCSKVPQQLPAPKKIPLPPPTLKNSSPIKLDKGAGTITIVPKTLADFLGTKEATPLQATATKFPGGEREALKRLKLKFKDQNYIAKFEKPKTVSTNQAADPAEPTTTGLSPYLKFGCLSVRTLWHETEAVYKKFRGKHAKPPMSLHGQLYFREQFYLLGRAVANFDKTEGNLMCKRIPWGSDAKLQKAWKEGKTGYPFIDALMRQLLATGWMHHLGRHAVSCFLTRGQLWQSWTVGRDHFDKHLLDADWSLNNANWLWLAGVAPYSMPYFRIYDPCPGNTSSLNVDPKQDGKFVRHWCPALKNMPQKYLYAPWEAPPDVQQKAGCVVGRDYPAPVVDKQKARAANLAKFGAAVKKKAGGDNGPAPKRQKN